MTGPAVPPVGEELSLDERFAVWLAVNAPEIREPYRLGAELATWTERHARQRAAEELRAAAADWPPTWAVDPATYLRDRADALTDREGGDR